MGEDAGVTSTDQQIQYPCEGCGASLEFAPGTDSLRCPYCGHETTIGRSATAFERHPYADLIRHRRQRTARAGATVFVCPGCGAHTESTDIARRCPFCDTPMVTEVSPREQIVPDGVLPFAVDRAALTTVVRQWTSTRSLAPGALKEVTGLESWRSTYLPHWVFSCTLKLDVSGWTRSSPKERQAHLPVTDMTVPATTVVPAKTLAELGPWSLASAQPLRAEYLEGHEAVRYDVEPDSAVADAKSRMAEVAAGKAYGFADEANLLTGDYADRWRKPRYVGLDVALVLLPVWVACYLYAGRTYCVYVNGSTGQASGDYPESRGKSILFVISVIVILLLVSCGVAYLSTLKDWLLNG